MRQNFLSNIAYKIVGARGSPILFLDHFKQATGPEVPHDTLHSNYGQTFSNNESLQEIVQNNRLIFFGEIHSVPSIVAFQCELLKEMTNLSTKPSLSKHSNFIVSEERIDTMIDEVDTIEDSKEIIATQSAISTVHVIMEHFSFEMQQLLDDYIRNGVDYTFDEFKQKYREIGTEFHDLEPYRPLLELARDNPDTIMVHAGFIPRDYARLLMKEGPAIALECAAQFLPKDSLSNNNILKGSELHFNVFSSLLSGEPIIVPGSVTTDSTKENIDLNSEQKSNDDSSRQEFRRAIFVAQLLKDVAMANKVNTIIDQYRDDKFLIIAGNGHLLHYCGVPERVLRTNPELADQTCLIVSASCDKSSRLVSETIDYDIPKDINAKGTSSYERLDQYLTSKFGPKGSYPSDYVYLFENDDDDDDEEEKIEEEKEPEKTTENIGESNHLA